MFLLTIIKFIIISFKESFDNLKFWSEEIKHHRNDDTKMLLIGNKSDLISQRAIDFTKAKVQNREKSRKSDCAFSQGICRFIEHSIC